MYVDSEPLANEKKLDWIACRSPILIHLRCLMGNFLIFKFLFYDEYILLAHMSVYHMHACLGPQRSEGGFVFSRTGIRNANGARN